MVDNVQEKEQKVNEQKTKEDEEKEKITVKEKSKNLSSEQKDSVQDNSQVTEEGKEKVSSTKDVSVAEIEKKETEQEKKEELETEEKDKKVEENIEEEKSTQEKEEKSVLENEIAMYEKTMETVRVGNIVEGKIIQVNSTEVLVDIGYKAEGVIPLSDFKDTSKVKEGGTVSVYIMSKENRHGRPRLSKKKADIRNTWDALEQKSKTEECISVKITKRVKGGLITNYKGIQGFLPASQVSVKTLPNLDHLIGDELEVKIINIDRPKSNVVYSRKIVQQKKKRKEKNNLIQKLEENLEVDGVVKNIMDYGVFVDLGGIDGLVHISDMSWGHITHPSEMLSIGDKIKVKVLSFDKHTEKVSLGLKQLVPHPWKNIEVKYPEGSKIKGKVTNLANFGAFVELEKGVEGLVHISEMSWTKKISHPKQLLKVGDVVEAIVLSIDKNEHRISLGLKQIEPNPWLTIELSHPVESKVTGKIKNITEFGAFMEVDDNIDGLIHISDISWTKRIMHPKEVLKKGQDVTAVVLSIDKVMQRIALGLKQLEKDPWEEINENMPLNSEHKVKIVKIISKGAIVRTDSGVEGFIPSSHLGIPGLQEPKLAFDTNEELPVKVIELDKENRRLILSVKTFFFGREEKEVNEFVKDHLKKIKEARAKRRKQKREKEKQKQAQKKEEFVNE